MNKEINFMNKVFIDTDYIGKFYYDQCRVIGWQDYANGVYYNLDEVKELFNKGLAGDNVRQNENGELYMHSQHCSAITVGDIVCGILVKGDRNGKNKNLYDYAEKEGWITNNPIPIKMTVFTKELKINDNGTYDIKLTFDKNRFDKRSYNYLEKICVGSIKKLKYKFCICHGKETTIDRKYNCGDIIFDKNELIMTIKDIPKQYIGKETGTIRSLDLELAIMTTNKYNTYTIETASITAIRDDGQYHWLNESEDYGKKLSNIFWYNKDEEYYEEISNKILKQVSGNMAIEDWYEVKKGTKVYYKEGDKTIFGYFTKIRFDGVITISKIQEDNHFSKLKMNDRSICTEVYYDKVRVY